MGQSINDNFTIRLIESADNTQVKELVVDVMATYSCIGEGYSSSDEELEDMYTAYADHRSDFYVVVDSQNMVYGCGGIAPLKGSSDNICELRKMYFYASIRGLGLGSQLMSILLSKAREYAYKQCYLETVSGMKEARILYEKVGFLPINSSLGSTGHNGCDNYMLRYL